MKKAEKYLVFSVFYTRKLLYQNLFIINKLNND